MAQPRVAEPKGTPAGTNGTDQNRDNYALGRGGLSDWRLTFQHFIVTQQQGWLIHPTISTALSQRENIRIADLATGNAVWALAVAEQYPHAQIIGTDITDEQFPSKTSFLPNTSFDLQNMFDPVPPHMLGAFDFVHLRLTLAWIANKDKDLLVRNVLSMIKPGGFVQWDDVVSPPLWIYHPDGRVERGLSRTWERALGLSGILPEFTWLASLPDLFRQYGMVDAVSVQPQASRALLPACKQALTWGFTELFETLIKVGVPGAKEQFELAIKEWDEDHEEGKQFAYGWGVAVAQKPVEN